MRTDYKSGRSFLNHETIALDDVLISVFNKDMGLHFLTYFPGTFFGSLAIKKVVIVNIHIIWLLKAVLKFLRNGKASLIA